MKHWLLPTAKNGHKAKLLKPMGLSLLMAVYCLNQLILHKLPEYLPGVLGYASEITAQKVFDATNSQRVALGLPKLKYNPRLAQSATQKAEDMFSQGYWAHNSPDGKTPWYFFKLVGYSYEQAGENLAKDFYDTDSLLTAWMNSPTHRENIVNSKYAEVGIGVVNGSLNGYKTTLVVQHFGTPLSGPIEGTVDYPSQLPDKNLAGATSKSIPISTLSPINPLHVSKIVSTLLFSLLIGVMFIDGYMVVKKGIHRLSGSSIAHIAFLLVIFVVILVIHQGAII